MEFSEESIDHHTLVFKGKRSKRPRQLSPSPDVYSSSPTTSTTQISSSSSTEEDEDMANCLILLAQSGHSKKHKTTISSRKFAEMATSSTGKAGFYVYECKTCNRTFPSFQALGGHRTSHKKGQFGAQSIEKSKRLDSDHVSKSENENRDHGVQEVAYLTQNMNKGNLQSNLHFKKIHECTICGAEFTSGQALGGHMRRHRPPTAIATTTTNPVWSHNSKSSQDFEIKENPRIFLSLDLNLPAPVEDEHRLDNSKYDFSGNKQSIVFSSAALVDCHY